MPSTPGTPGGGIDGGGPDRRDSGMLDGGSEPGGLEMRDVGKATPAPCVARDEGGPGGGGMVGRKARRAIILDTSAPFGSRLLPISDAREAFILSARSAIAFSFARVSGSATRQCSFSAYR
jgi:hypothetical protein